MNVSSKILASKHCTADAGAGIEIHGRHAWMLDSKISDARHTVQQMLVLKIKIHGRHSWLLASKISACRHCTADAMVLELKHIQYMYGWWKNWDSRRPGGTRGDLTRKKGSEFAYFPCQETK